MLIKSQLFQQCLNSILSKDGWAFCNNRGRYDDHEENGVKIGREIVIADKNEKELDCNKTFEISLALHFLHPHLFHSNFIPS